MVIERLLLARPGAGRSTSRGTARRGPGPRLASLSLGLTRPARQSTSLQRAPGCGPARALPPTQRRCLRERHA